MGRNVWQNEHPVAIMKAIRAIVHENIDVAEAHKLFLAETITQ
jgi:putative autoinducer-2 (AI-2) aldolase